MKKRKQWLMLVCIALAVCLVSGGMYYLGMRVSEIAAAEEVDPSRVRDSIRRGLKQLAKYF